MAADKLRFRTRPALTNGRMVLAFTGWMDGGDVSTGTVKHLVRRCRAKHIADIDSEGFYIYNFPGAMEVASLFRPPVEIVDGLVKDLRMPVNTFFCDVSKNLVFFLGKEPNLNWRDFADCVFGLADEVGVTSIYFVGSFGGTVPHTREPRLYVSVSDARLRPTFQRFGMKLSSYEGPGSFATYLTTQATARGLDMVNIVAEIPGYLQGANPLSIEAVTRRLAPILGLEIDLAEMREASNEWESQVTAAVAKDADLAKQIRDLEEQYDNDLIEKPEENLKGLMDEGEDQEAPQEDGDAPDDEDAEPPASGEQRQ